MPSSNHNYDNVLNILQEKMFEFKIDRLPQIMIYLITKSVFLGQVNNLIQLYQRIYTKDELVMVLMKMKSKGRSLEDMISHWIDHLKRIIYPHKQVLEKFSWVQDYQSMV